MATKTKKKEEIVVSAEDFLAELESSDEPLILAEEDEIVTEDDIMAELSAAPVAPTASVKNDDVLNRILVGQESLENHMVKLLHGGNAEDMFRDLQGQVSSLQKLLQILEVNTSRILDAQEVVAKGLATLLRGNAVTGGKEVPPFVPTNKVPVEEPASETEKYIIDTTIKIVSGFKSDFRVSLDRLAQAICQSKFGNDASTLPKIAQVCRTRLGDLGTIEGDLFIRS